MSFDIIGRMMIFPVFSKLISAAFNPETDVVLKKTESRALMEIRYSEGKPMSFYSSKVDLEHGSFTYLVDKLEKKGLIKRVSVDGDRRKKILFLTDLGKSISDTIQEQLTQYMSDKVNLLDESEQKELFEVVEVVERLRASMLKKMQE